MSINLQNKEVSSKTSEDIIRVFEQHKVSLINLVDYVTIAIIALAALVVACLFLSTPVQLTFLLSIVVGSLLAIQMFIYCVLRRKAKEGEVFPPEDKKPLPIEKRPTLPKLPDLVMKEVQKAELEPLHHIHENTFFPSFEEWRQVFLKDSCFLLNSALDYWNAWQHKEGPREGDLELYRDYTKFSILVTNRSFQETKQQCREKQQKLCYVHQLSIEEVLRYQLPLTSKTTRVCIGDTRYILSVVDNPLTDPKSSREQSLYCLFKRLFLRYFLALNHSISSEQVVAVHPFTTGIEDPQVAQIEWLALFCAIEQLRYTPKPTSMQLPIPTNPSEAPVYILSPADYWKIFVKKETASLTVGATHFGLVAHPTHTANTVFSELNVNRARFVDTQHLILTNTPTSVISILSKFAKS